MLIVISKKFMVKIDIIILCGGRGKRLKNLTTKTPKPLLKIDKKKPFLEYLINFFLKSKEVDKIILACGYKVEMFHKLVSNKFKKEKRIQIIDSGRVDIIKRIKSCEKIVSNSFMVCYGDSFATIDLKKYLSFFNKNKKYGLVLSSFFKFQFGTLKIKKGINQVTGFIEKPVHLNPLNLGYIIFANNFFKYINKFNSWLSFLEYISKNNKLKYFNFKGLYVTYNNLLELKIAGLKMKEVQNFIKAKKF